MQLRWWQGWLPLLLLPLAVFVAVPAQPRWLFMWALAFAIYCGCKWLTWRRTPVAGAPLWKHAAYLLAWPGMDAGNFLRSPSAPLPRPTMWQWLFALGKTALGLVLVFGVASQFPEYESYDAGLIGMIGIVLTLHFGLFALLACFWQALGVEAKPLMDWPVTSTSLSEFWGRRWNTAFRDLTHRFLFRPLIPRVGPKWAHFLGFAFSGIVHDVVITVPAGGGYGDPTVFFLIQWLAILLQRSPEGRSFGWHNGFRGWTFTMLLLLGTMNFLVPAPFVLDVMVPFLRAMGAIS